MHGLVAFITVLFLNFFCFSGFLTNDLVPPYSTGNTLLTVGRTFLEGLKFSSNLEVPWFLFQ